MPWPHRINSSRGFTLVEAVITVIIVGLAMSAITWGLAMILSPASSPIISYSGNVYSQAPSFSDYQSALDLNFALTNSVDTSDAVLVFGGTNSNPVYDPTGPSDVYKLGLNPTSLTAMASGDPMTQFSSWAQLNVNSSQLVANMKPAGSPADLTIFTIQGLSRITSVTQQRRYSVNVSGQSYHLYEVSMQLIDWGTGSPVLTTNPTSGTLPTYSYRFYYLASEDLWYLAPGATHKWFRQDETWNRVEESVLVVLADPFVMGGDSTAAIAPMSRFVHFLPTVQ